MRGGHSVGKLHGTLCGDRQRFLQEMRHSRCQLGTDMSGVAFLDSAGVGALVQLFVHRRNQGRSSRWRADAAGMAVMQVSGLLKFMPVFASVTEAKRRLKLSFLQDTEFVRRVAGSAAAHTR